MMFWLPELAVMSSLPLPPMITLLPAPLTMMSRAPVVDVVSVVKASMIVSVGAGPRSTSPLSPMITASPVPAVMVSVPAPPMTIAIPLAPVVIRSSPPLARSSE